MRSWTWGEQHILLDHTIREVLSLFPRGATDAQLIWRLRSSALRIEGTELLAGLVDLSERGEIIRDTYGRWRSARLSRGVLSKDAAEVPRTAQRNTHTLYAIRATCRSRRQLPESTSAESVCDAPLPD